jgi:hypothetical protein
MEKVKKILPWKNDKCIKISSSISNNFDLWDDFTYQMELVDLSDNVISKITLNKARGYFDIIPVLSKDIIVVGYFNYIQNDSYVMIDLYKLTSTTNEFNLQYQYKIKSEYSCGGTSGKICKNGSEIFYLIWTDICNSDHFSYFEFDLDFDLDLSSKLNKSDDNLARQIKFTENIDSSWDNIFMVSPDNLLYSRALGHNSNQIELALFDASKSYCFSISTLTLPNNIVHYSDYNVDIKVEEFDTIIYDFFCFSSKSKTNVYCLIRIKTYYKLDPLHIQNYFIDTIVQVDGADSKPVEISNPIYFSTSEDYNGYFGKRPYLIKQLDLDGNNIVKIFNENTINNNINK